MVVGGRELIDTLWNVNTTYADGDTFDLYELIDTLWNVNTLQKAVGTPQTLN